MSSSVKFIPASGTGKNGLMIIGEAPGEKEDLEGKPFVGRAGKMLDKMLAYINISRQDTYITNIVKVRPDNNRTPTSEEIDSWRDILTLELSLIKPKVILTLGNCASKAVLKTEEGISKIRGKSYSYLILNDLAMVVPTYHPSYLLRKNVDKKTNEQVKKDLNLAKELLNK